MTPQQSLNLAHLLLGLALSFLKQRRKFCCRALVHLPPLFGHLDGSAPRLLALAQASLSHRLRMAGNMPDFYPPTLHVILTLDWKTLIWWAVLACIASYDHDTTAALPRLTRAQTLVAGCPRLHLLSSLPRWSSFVSIAGAKTIERLCRLCGGVWGASSAQLALPLRIGTLLAALAAALTQVDPQAVHPVLALLPVLFCTPCVASSSWPPPFSSTVWRA
jgi:hypothetical protein